MNNGKNKSDNGIKTLFSFSSFVLYICQIYIIFKYLFSHACFQTRTLPLG